MGWINDIVENVVKPVVEAVAPLPTAIVEVATGKDPVDAVTDVVAAPVATPLGAASTAVNAVADVEAKVAQLESALIGKVGGEGAANLFRDLRRVGEALNPQIDIEIQRQLIDSTQRFVETLDPRHLSPLAILLAAEIKRARDDAWDRASPIPASVAEAMPADLHELARTGRYIQIDNINQLALPTFAIEHFDKASAVAAIDLVFFKAVPGSTSVQDLFYWCHELTHFRQYKTLTLNTFAARYISAELEPGDKVNVLEEEADRYACQCFPGGSPSYIDACSSE